MTFRGKEFRALSPKKVSRRKRTPRCDSCGKRDGEDARTEPGEEPRKVRLKLCARCRAVAYCGMECQKAGWKRHREVCVKYVNAADLPPPSPLVNHKNTPGASGVRGRRKIIYGGTVSTLATPRQRENAPTRHPFFGRQESSELRERLSMSAGGSSHGGAGAGGNRSRLGSRSSNGSTGGKRSTIENTTTATSMPTAGVATVSPSLDTLNPAFVFHTTSSDHRRIILSPAAASRDRRSSYVPPPPPPPPPANGTLASLGSVSPPDPISSHEAYFSANAASAVPEGRRVSAPLFPSALEDSRHKLDAKRSSLPTTAVSGASRRGPPPPYALVAHRADSLRSNISSISDARERRAASGSSVVKSALSIMSGSQLLADQGVSPSAPSLPAPRLTPSASYPPPSSRDDPPPAPPPPPPPPPSPPPPSHPPFPAKETAVPSYATGFPDVLLSLRVEENATTKAHGLAAAANHVGISPNSSSEGTTPLSSSGGKKSVARAEAGTTSPVTVSPAKRAAEEEGAGGAPEKHQKLVGAHCEDSALGTEKKKEQETGKEKEGEGEEKEGEGGEKEGCGGNDDTARVPVKPPPPILPVSVIPGGTTAAAGTTELARIAMSGTFDSCPSSAGVAGFAAEKSARNPPPHRSLSDGTSSSLGKSHLTVTAKKSLGAAAAAAMAWSLGRKRSPRPRPPLSPGPAALSRTTPSKSPTRAQEESMVALSATSPGRAPATASAAASAAAATAAALSAGSFGGCGGSKRPSLASAVRPVTGEAAARMSPRSTIGGKISPRSGKTSPRSPPFVPAVELSPEVNLATTPLSPGPRPTRTAVFYQRRPGGIGLPPASRAYLGRPEGFFVHVLVASALTAADLEARVEDPPTSVGGSDSSDCHAVGSIPLALRAARREKASGAADGVQHRSRVYYSFDERGKVAAALQPGDVVLLTPGRYEARAWGLQQLVSSVEIIGAGCADTCVVYNNPPPPAAGLTPSGEHYLVGVMGGAVLGVGDGGGAGGGKVPEVKGKNDIDDDSDSGWEDGATDSAGNAFGGSAVRVRLANLTLEQGSGYRGAVYQVGRESHLEMDGCIVRCAQGGVNVDQGTCLLCDSTIIGSQTFGVHIGGEGTVEHCSVQDCGRGTGRGRKGAPRGGRGRGGGGGRGSPTGSSRAEGVDSDEGDESEDDGTDVNRARGMPAISVLQSSRVRVRYNVIRDNAGHALQRRDASLPGGDEKRAMLARRAEVEAEEEKHREGSIIAEGNQCQLNEGCSTAKCSNGGVGGSGSGCLGGGAGRNKGGLEAALPGGERSGGGRGGGEGRGKSEGGSVSGDGEAVAAAEGGGAEEVEGGDAASPRPAAAAPAAVVGVASAASDKGFVRDAAHGKGGKRGLNIDVGGDGERSSISPLSAAVGEAAGGSGAWSSEGQVCVPTAEEEGLPLPAAMTLRFLAAMDEGHVGSMREENERLRRKGGRGGGGGVREEEKGRGWGRR
eukprot:jgi/Undpi1/14069/HiC_scaffold_9.g03720.m1